MNHIRRKSPFWSLAGPLLAYWAIQVGVQFVIELLVEVPYMMRASMEMLQNGTAAGMTFEEIMRAYLEAVSPALELLLRYQVEIVGLSALCTFPLTIILFKKDRKLERDCGIAPPFRVPVSNYWTIAVMGLVGSIGVTCLATMFQAVFYDAQYQQSTQEIYASPFALQLIALGVVVPLAEELMFRGIMFRRYRENQGFFYSALWSSLFFSFMHTNGTQMIYTFFLGVLLCYLYDRFGSFKAPAALHIAVNTGSVVFTQIGLFRWLSEGAERMSGAVIVSAFICSAMFVLIQRIERPEEKPPEEKKDPLDMFR